MANRQSFAKVLLVDDEQDITLILKQTLELNGFEVDIYNETERALANYKPNFYDVILRDIRMPGKNGFEIARALGECPFGADMFYDCL